MKRSIFLLNLFICLCILLSSCSKNIDNNAVQYDNKLSDIATVNDNVVSKEVVTRFVESVKVTTPSEENDENHLEGAYAIEPILMNDVTVFWVVNYEKGGFMLLSANKEHFPILKYSTTGSFHYTELVNTEKSSFDNMIQQYYTTMTNTSEHITRGQSDSVLLDVQEFNIWEEIAETLNTEEGYSYEIGIDMSHKHDSDEQYDMQTRSAWGGSGRIPDRQYRRNYPWVYPMIWKQWSCKSPYNYDTPYRNNLSAGGVGLALILDYHRADDYYFWYNLPSKQTTSESTTLTKFLNDFCVELGQKHSYTTPYPSTVHKRERFEKEIPTLLNQKYGYKLRYPDTYYPDQAGFESVRLHLTNVGPVLYLTSANAEFNSFVIDGVAELETKVTKRKYFLGILIKTTVTYYYADWYHVVDPSNRDKDDWQIYDWKSEGNNAKIFLVEPK